MRDEFRIENYNHIEEEVEQAHQQALLQAPRFGNRNNIILFFARESESLANVGRGIEGIHSVVSRDRVELLAGANDSLNF
jgi:hypothetical protein